MDATLAARCVPLRELSRSTRELIDQVERDGKVFAVSRHGRMVALVMPLPERLILEFEDRSPVRKPEEIVETPEELDELGLSTLEGDLLVDVATNASPTGVWRTECLDPPIRRALLRLEAEGLIDFLGSGSRRITRKGRGIAAALQR